MKFAKLVMVLFAWGLVSTSVIFATETDTDWTVVLYEQSTNSLVTLHPDGTTTHPLPNVGYGAQVIMVSDDFRYAVGLFQNHYNASHVDEVTIIDLISDEVRYVAPPPLEESEFFIEYERILLSADMSEVAVAYTSHDMTSGFGCCGFGGIIVVELSTGEITHHLDVDNTFDRPDSSSAWFAEWTPEGIWFAPLCWACTPPVKFFYHLWNPDNDTVVPTNRYDNIRYAERLETTGELLYGENHIDFPAGGLTFINEYVALNVVSVYQPNESTPDTEGQVIYFDIDNLQFLRPRWIIGGQAFLVRGAKNAVIFRDGTLIEFDADWWYTEFIAMTSDGWLAKNTITGDVLHYTVEENQIISKILYQSHSRLTLTNHRLEPLKEQLPAFVQEITPPDEPFCAGNLPNRLSIGSYAKVTNYPGGMIGLWVTDGGIDISRENWILLPVGTVVQIISEPECLAEVWVKVKHRDTTGWMVETWWGSYYLEPADRPVGVPY